MVHELRQYISKVMDRKITGDNVWPNVRPIVRRVIMLLCLLRPRGHIQFAQWVALKSMNLQSPLAAPGTCSHPLTHKLFPSHYR